MNNEILFEIIKTSIRDIDREINQTNGTGIYFAPELYVAFSIGQNIFKQRKNIFNSLNVLWSREINLGKKGISDIVFKHIDSYTVIEIKLRNTIDSYRADIAKLKLLKDNFNKYFCVLADSFSSISDERLISLENEYTDDITLIGREIFETWNNWYKGQIYCHLNLYSINS